MKTIFSLGISLALLATTKVQAQSEKGKLANVQATYQILIDAPIESVWKELAVNFGGIGQWASGVNHVVESSGEGLSAKRFCEINAAGFNDTRERIIRYEPQDYYFEYELYEGLPGFVDYAINKEKLEEKDGKTLWTSKNVMRVGGIFGATLKKFMTKKVEDVLAAKAHELKHFVETGRQHPNKLAAIAKKEKKALFVLDQRIDAPVQNVWKVLVEDFSRVADSHPVSPKSAYYDGSSSPIPGARRIMFMKENEKKYFIDEIQELEQENHRLLINVVEAKGYPMKFTQVEFVASHSRKGATNLSLVFTYQTNPRFLQGLAKKSLQKQLKQYLQAIDHHVRTGELITSSNWKEISKNYNL